MTWTRNRTVAAVFVAAAFSAACGGNGADATSAEMSGQTGAAPAAAQAPKKNACALLDREQIEGIAGQKLDMLHNIESDDHTVCELSAAGTNTMLISVTVYWRGGKELARTNEAAMSLAKHMMNDDEVDIEALTGSGKAPGLADKAYYSDLMPSWLLKGDVLIEILSPRFGHDQTKGVFLSVAKSALPRL